MTRVERRGSSGDCGESSSGECCSSSGDCCGGSSAGSTG